MHQETEKEINKAKLNKRKAKSNRNNKSKKSKSPSEEEIIDGDEYIVEEEEDSNTNVTQINCETDSSSTNFKTNGNIQVRTLENRRLPFLFSCCRCHRILW